MYIHPPPLLMLILFMPHGMCYLWKPLLVSLHLVSDLFISLAYFSIPYTLFRIFKTRKDIPYNHLFLLFACFILFCGIGHVFDVITLWFPYYWVSGFVRFATACVSVSTSFALFKLIPKIISLPSLNTLKKYDSLIDLQTLESQIQSQRDLEKYLKELNSELQNRIDTQTEELITTSRILEKVTRKLSEYNDLFRKDY